MGYSSWGHEESDMTERLSTKHQTLSKLDNAHPGSPSPYIRYGDSKGQQGRESQDAPILSVLARIVTPRDWKQFGKKTSGLPWEVSQTCLRVLGGRGLPREL